MDISILINVEERMHDVRKITLHPLAGPGLPTSPASSPESIATQKLMLVIDDSLTMRKLLTACLHRAGFRVMTFADGIEAMRWLGQPDSPLPDLVLLDIGLPRIDGYEVARRLKAAPRFNQIMIVMLSRRNGVLDRLKGRLAGARAYLTKPVKTQELLATISALLSEPAPDQQKEEQG